jgi:DNA-directed RNA polymerase subunit RPC12/RpoP
MVHCTICKKPIKFPGKYKKGERYVCRKCYFKRMLQTKVRIFRMNN